MISRNRIRNAAATAALTSAVAIAVAVTGSVQADNSTHPGRIDDLPPVPSPVHSPPDLQSLGRPESGEATSYVVAAGDSFWAIAERILPAGAAGRDVARLTDELIELNAPTLRYDVATMVHPGDVVAMPATPAASRPDSMSVTTPAHTVVAGDSYWAIAQSTLGTDAAPAEVLAKTEQLIELNSARLGYTDPQLLHPGDVVYLEPLALPMHKEIEPSEVTEKPEVTETARHVTEKPTHVARPTRDPEAPNPPADRVPARVEVPAKEPRSETAIITTSNRPAEETPAVDTASPVWHARWNRFIGGAGAGCFAPAAPAAPTSGAHGRAIAN